MCFKQRYDNQSLIVQSHMRSILDAPFVDQPCFRKLQALRSHFELNLAAQKAVGQPTDHWDAWLVTFVVSRLDGGTCHD